VAYCQALLRMKCSEQFRIINLKTNYIVTVLINHKTMKMYEAMEVYINPISIQC